MTCRLYGNELRLGIARPYPVGLQGKYECVVPNETNGTGGYTVNIDLESNILSKYYSQVIHGSYIYVLLHIKQLLSYSVILS